MNDSAGGLPVSLTEHGETRVLVASGLGEHSGGGIALWGGDDEVREVDRISTCGMAVSNGRVARALFADGVAGPSSVGELLIYDADGLLRYHRLDGVADVHDVGWDGDDVVLASTGTNRLVWIDASGRPTRVWQAPGHNDAWHLNCVAFRDGRLHATAFCRATDHRAWFAEAEHGRGVLFEVPEARVVVEGLHSPHTPRWLDGMWLVLDSARRALVGFDPDTGRCVRQVELGGWTRGLVASDGHLLVGVSATRRGAGVDRLGRAHIVVLERVRWTPVGRIMLPWQEVYELLLVAPELAEGLQRGCDTNPLRKAESEARARPPGKGTSIWSDVLHPDPDGLRVSIAATVPAVLETGSCVDIACTVTNRGTEHIRHSPPAPTLLTYKWLEAESGDWTARDGGEVLQSVRTRLPSDLAPGETLVAAARVEAPPTPGRRMLRLTLLDEGVGWFDDLDAANGLTLHVDIVPAAQPPRLSRAARAARLVARLFDRR